MKPVMIDPISIVAAILPEGVIRKISDAQWQYAWLSPLFAVGRSAFSNRDATIRKGIGRGLRFNCGTSTVSYVLGTAEPLVQEALGVLIRPGIVVFDIGANVGFVSLIAARLVGSAGQVFCFEPVPENLTQLRHNISLNSFQNIHVRDEAIGDADGAATIMLGGPTIGKLTSVAKAGYPHSKQTIPVSLRKLDSLCSDGVIPEPDFIKIDVEGAEIAVLDGARSILLHRRPVLLIELHGTRLGVAEILDQSGYDTRLLGKSGSIETASDTDHIIAVPRQ